MTSGGKDVYTGALGYSMTGVPATPAMHFRNGAMAFTYMSTMLMELVDRKKVTLDDKVSKWFPAPAKRFYEESTFWNRRGPPVKERWKSPTSPT